MKKSAKALKPKLRTVKLSELVLMWQGKVRILVNEEVGPSCFRMALEAPQVASEARAGQFLHVRVAAGYSPLLRRPFSVHRISGKLKVESLKLQNIEILYEVVGKGTKTLAEKQVGEELDILGPLGNGFNLPGGLETAILIAGGIGVAPLLALAEEIVQSSKPKVQSRKVDVIIGAKTKKLVLCEEGFKELGCQVRVATEDGSVGYSGTAVDLFKESLSTFNFGVPTEWVASTVYACGPEIMLKKIAEMTYERDIPAQLSLEGRLGCGVGACLGCAIKVKNSKGKGEGDFSYKRICKDGPVFEANEVVWD